CACTTVSDSPTIPISSEYEHGENENGYDYYNHRYHQQHQWIQYRMAGTASPTSGASATVEASYRHLLASTQYQSHQQHQHRHQYQQHHQPSSPSSQQQQQQYQQQQHHQQHLRPIAPAPRSEDITPHQTRLEEKPQVVLWTALHAQEERYLQQMQQQFMTQQQQLQIQQRLHQQPQAHDEQRNQQPLSSAATISPPTVGSQYHSLISNAISNASMMLWDEGRSLNQYEQLCR
ncbi:hypothetical protein BGX34_009740, partial [Mortierella sp. NVP85]